MLGIGSWRARHNKTSPTPSMNALDESYQLEDAMRGSALIMDDDVEGAERELNSGDSPFHKIGKGVVTFLRATLGFEQEIMSQAAQRLADAEASAIEHQRRASREPPADKSAVYPPGTAYALCGAEAQLMAAVVAVITESLTESIKGFYKLRKAYITLDGIIQAQDRYNISKSTSTLNSLGRASKYSDSSLSHPDKQSSSDLNGVSREPKANTAGDDDDEDEFFDAGEVQDKNTSLEGSMANMSVNNKTQASKQESASLSMSNANLGSSGVDEARSQQDARSDTLANDSIILDNPMDVFIHSGSSMAYGLLLLMISLIPPAFAMLLKIVGFRGDRERGISLLWQATNYHNVYGALSGLILFGYYNGLIGFCDILPDSGNTAYPKERLRKLLAEMRNRFPKSHMWQLEQARMTAGDHELEKAVELLSDGTVSPLKQVEALRCFENGLNNMHLHQYEATSELFHKVIKLNNWSHGLYYYIAASAHLELYRQLKTTDTSSAQTHADRAMELFRIVPDHAGKKRFMARQLPFDVFVARKIQKWEARALSRDISLADAIGVSPLEEMIYFWNGHRRMRPEQLQVSLERLAWSEDPATNPQWVNEGLEERAALAVLRAAVLRRLGKHAEAMTQLREEILCHAWLEFKGPLKDAWPCPVAHYEMAVNLWQVRDGSDQDRARVRECSEWLEKVARWEGFELDARIGMKVNTAKDTIKKYEAGRVA